MSMIQKEKKAGQTITPLLFGIFVAAIACYFVIFATPVIGELPVEITEEVKIIIVTEKGVVFETSSGVSVLTDQYDGQIGEIIEVTYHVPAKYLEVQKQQQARWDAFQPDS